MNIIHPSRYGKTEQKHQYDKNQQYDDHRTRVAQDVKHFFSYEDDI